MLLLQGLFAEISARESVPTIVAIRDFVLVVCWDIQQ